MKVPEKRAVLLLRLVIKRRHTTIKCAREVHYLHADIFTSRQGKKKVSVIVQCKNASAINPLYYERYLKILSKFPEPLACAI